MRESPDQEEILTQMAGFFKPRETLTEADVQKGMKSLLYDGMCSQVMGVLTGGAFLVAFALILGASNKVIGLLAAIGPLTQTFQIPAIFLVDRLRRRKAIVIVMALFGRLFWLLIASLPWFFPMEARIPIFLGSLFIYFSFGNISGCAFNSWMRDLIPEKVMGSFYARRMMLATATGAGLSLVAGIGIDFLKQHVPTEMAIYSSLLFIGGIGGLAGLFFLSRIPEPRMTGPKGGPIFSILAEPFKNRNFRFLLMFLGTWNFAVNLAAPFFTVYLLRRLDQSMSWVIGLSVISQLFNVAFLRIWGRLADRFSNKSVLTVSGPLFMISILLWPFTTMPDIYVLTFPLLIVIHALAGMSTAGVTLCAGNIALKSAPKGTATAYLATNALISGLAASLAPILGGLAADTFTGYQLSIDLQWTSLTNGHGFSLPALNLQGLDFLFIISFIVGLYALHRLLAVKEEGEVEDDVVVTELYSEVRKMARGVSNIPGLRQVTAFPYNRLRDMLGFDPTEKPTER